MFLYAIKLLDILNIVITYFFLHRTPVKNVETTPLKPQYPTDRRSCKDIDINVCTIVDVDGSNGCSEVDGTPQSSQQWNEADPEGGQGPPQTETVAEQKDTAECWDKKEMEGSKDAEQKLYHVANELLQTERAYVARLHLLDQVGKVDQFQSVLKTWYPACRKKLNEG